MRVISCENRLPAKGLRIYTGPGTPGVLDDPCHISLCTLCDHFLSPSPGTVCANPVALFRGHICLIRSGRRLRFSAAIDLE